MVQRLSVRFLRWVITKKRKVKRQEKRQSYIGIELNLSTSTIRTILKNKEKILSSATTTTTTSATKITRSRNNVIEEMEKRLSIWIDDEVERNIPLSQAIIVENIQITGEAASEDTKAPDVFPVILKAIIERENYPPELVFNFDETGLFWKRMPKRTFLSREEKRAPGFKAAKDRLILLLGGNANGDFKLKPLLIYHSETPRAMKGISKSTLPVIWESNKKSWITMNIFQNWFTEHFCPSVKRYCEFKNLEPKALLLIDNAPSHLTHLSNLTTCIPVEMVFLPPNTTSLIQPMDQGVVSNFKASYLRWTFRQLIDKTDGKGLDNINAQDIEELLQVITGESLSNDDLKEFVEQQVHEDDEVSVSEDEEQRGLSLDFLKKKFSHYNGNYGSICTK
ncbi:PREDICTED: tigger transposable element-derived protein 1-like [Polistes dominula]|uniref:Tigger transposable element-derived protein 1-like n=1 Tax=Polistes dominula TaxID=743375 RepID=A0ABM1J337_POLDO|nr:PREDICTED: tigger transposable element-derived protein 1-like [Polistes dominula]